MSYIFAELALDLVTCISDMSCGDIILVPSSRTVFDKVPGVDLDVAACSLDKYTTGVLRDLVACDPDVSWAATGVVRDLVACDLDVSWAETGVVRDLVACDPDISWVALGSSL